MQTKLSVLIVLFSVLGTTGALAAESCELHPLLRGSDGAAAQCTNLDDGRLLNSEAGLPKVAVVKKLLEMGYVAKSDSTFIKP